MYNDDFYTSLPEALALTSNLQEKIKQIGMLFTEAPKTALREQVESIGQHSLLESTKGSIRDIVSHLGQLPISDFTDQMDESYSSLYNATMPPSALQDSIESLKNINLQEEFIELTEDNCKLINALLESSSTSNDIPAKISKGKMAMADFIKSVLIPILAIVLPMLLTIYYHKVDSIESQKRYIEELQQKEQELQLKEEELRIKEQQLQNDIAEKELLESILIEFQNQSRYCEFPESPDEAPEPFGEVPHSPDGTQDNGLSNPEVSKSSKTAMYKE